MEVSSLPHGRSYDAAADVAGWLAEIERTRDFTRAFVVRGGEPGPVVTDAIAFVRGLGGEMHAFESIVQAAVATASHNARQLIDIVASTEEQSAMVQRAAAAVGELDVGAQQVAGTAVALATMTDGVRTAMAEYDGGIADVVTTLDQVEATIAATSTFVAAIDGGARGVRAFLTRLATIARQAHLLGINAAIEAAHLYGVADGFGIVASEVSKLATSTAQSTVGVRDVERALSAAGKSVEGAIASSSAIAHGLVEDILGARGRSAAGTAQFDALTNAVRDVSASAADQSTDLTEISQNVQRCAHFAREIQAAAGRAAQLDLHGALERLSETIGRYRFDATAPDSRVGVEAFSAYGADVENAARSLRKRLDEDQLAFVHLLSALAVAVARNTYEWGGIARSLDGLRVEFRAVSESLDRAATNARRSEGAAHRLRGALDHVRKGFAASVDDLERSLDGAARIHAAVQQSQPFVAKLADAGGRAGAILALIDAISEDTTLLSLNAAIEAAHAGLAGSGFGVIADEIGSLAQVTLDATREIASVLASVSEAGTSMSIATDEAVAVTRGLSDRTSVVRGAVLSSRSELEKIMRGAGDVAVVVEQQFTAIAEARKATDVALQRIDGDFRAVADSRRIDLADIGMRAHALAARRPLGTTAEAVRAIGLATAEKMDAVFDAAIARGAIGLADCFDTNYIEITGERIRELARLFDVTRVPASGFLPAKFATRYDRHVEDGIDAIIDDDVPKNRAIKAMFAVDLNGYCFGHYRECRQAWTGDYTTDLNNNRIKRFFEDELSLRCARNGLGPGVAGLPPRTPRAVLAERGAILARGDERPWAIYTYARDTGIVYNDLSVALFAVDQRVGTIRIIYDADTV